jgi:hypothetical protein
VSQDARRHRRHRVLAPVLLGLIVALATVLVARQGVRIHGMVFYDEKYAVEGARFLDSHPGEIFSAHGYAGRGLERLTSFLFLPVIGLFDETADQFVAGHWLWALCWALLALPVYALARGLELRRRWALVAAAAAVFAPWAVLGTIFINTAPAATTAVAALWAMWRATVWPSSRGDALALALIALAGTARVSHLGLALAWPVAILVQGWRDLPVEQARRDRLRALPRAFVRDHRVLVGVAAVAALAIAVRGIDLVIGGYPSRLDFPVDALWRRLQLMVAHAAGGMGFLAFIVGVGWLARALVAPRDRRTGTFAVLAVASFCALLYVNHVGGYDERYEVPAIALVFVAFAAAVGRREVGVGMSLAVGAVTLYCVERYGFVGHREPFDFLNAPGRQWFSTGWIRTLEDATGARHGLLILVIVATATGVAIALGGAVRGRPARWVAGIAAFLVLWSGFSGARYLALRLPAGYRPYATFDDMTFVDRLTAGKPAYPLVGAAVANQYPRNTWLELQFFNRAIQRPVSTVRNPYYLCCLAYGYARRLTVNPETGTITAPSDVSPRYLLTTPDWVPAGVASRIVATSKAPIRPVSVERAQLPLQATWVAEGIPDNGVLAPGAQARLRVFPAGAPSDGPACLRATFVAPRRAERDAQWRLGGRRGTVEAQRRRRVEVPLPGLGRRTRPLEVVVGAGGAGAYAGIRNVRVVRCGSPDPVAKRHV